MTGNRGREGAVDTRAGNGKPTLRGELWDALLVARPGLWATQLWFYLLPLGGQRVLDEWTFWLGAVYVMFPLSYLLYGWNDLADYQTDQLNPRKGNLLFGARLPIARLRGLPLRIAAVQLPFWALFWWAIGPKFFLWVAACLAVNAAYNGLGLKGVPVLDVLNQAGYLLVFVLSSWVNGVPQLGWPAMVFGAFFAMHAHLLHETTDLEPDRRAGRRTTAAVIGVRWSKLTVAALLAAEAVIMGVWLDSPLVTAFLAAASLGFFIEAALYGDRVLSDRALKWVLIAWNVVAVASMYWVWSEAVFVAG